MLQFSNTPVSTLLNTTVVGQPWRDDYRLGLGVDAVTGLSASQAVQPFEVKEPQQLSTCTLTDSLPSPRVTCPA